MKVMDVVEKQGNVLFTVSYEDQEFRALQLVDRQNDRLHSVSNIEVGDQVLVVEIDAQLYAPRMSPDDAADSVSHIIIGMIPPSTVRNIAPGLVG